MLSAIIATHDSERSLVPTLTALVPGATAGLVREVILADAGSRDATAEVAEVAGCRLIASDAPLPVRLAQAAQAARAPWLLFLTAGEVPQPGWVEETWRFIEDAAAAGQADATAAVFRAVSPSLRRVSPLREAVTLLRQAAGLARSESRGLLIGRALYTGMVRDAAAASPADHIGRIVRRLGRRRIVTLHSGATGT